MALRIEDLKNGKAEKVNTLEIKIMKKVSDDKYIVADETAHTLLVSDQSLQEGSAYKLIKPSYGDSELRKNPKFAAIKVERKIKTKALKTEDEQILVAGLKDAGRKKTSKLINDFGSVDALGVGGTTEEIKLMVVSISSVISGKFGTYRIVNCKDFKNQKNSVNLYRSLQDVVEVGGVYMFTKLKVQNFKKEDQDFNRLGTTHATRILNEGKQGKDDFKEAGVMLGDKEVKGTIIGISELNVYESCSTCWCKVNDESFCRKCNQRVDIKKNDFNIVMYIQDDEQEDEILDIFSFKSTLGLTDIEKAEINEDNLNERMIGLKCVAEYYIDKTRDAEKLRLVKFNMIST
jgi:hypothetical protein